MNDWVEVEDCVDEDTGNRRIHLLANHAFGFDLPGDCGMEWVDVYLVPQGAAISVGKENGAFHLRGWWPYRGVLDAQPEGWPKFKRFVCWHLKGERVSKAMVDGTVYYTSVFGRYPGVAYIRKLPPKAEDGVEVEGVALISADWAPQGCLMIGG